MKALPSLEKRKALIDELGELDRQAMSWKPKADRREEIQTEIQSWYDGRPAKENFEMDGERYTVQVSARGLTRTITKMARLYALMGRVKFFEACKVTMKVIDKLIPVDQHAKFLEEKQDGKRKITVVPLAQARKAA